MRELELRGRLSQAEFDNAKQMLAKDAKSVENNKLSQFFIYPDGILKISKHLGNGRIILSLKRGDETSNNLEEMEAELAKGTYNKAVLMLENLGYAKREEVRQIRTDYILHDVTVSLKHTADWGLHFEVEMLLEESQDENTARTKLMAICEQYGLTPMSQDELSDFLLTIK